MRILKRFASETLRKQVKDLQADLEARDRTITVLQAEIDNLAKVVSRDRERIKSEGACYARQRAEHERVNSEQSTDNRIR